MFGPFFGTADVKNLQATAKHICKSKCTKHTILSPLLELRMSKNGTPLWREVRFQVKMYKNHVRTFFGNCGCQKLAGHCGAKHICKSKCTKHTILSPLLELRMSKNGTPLWREVHFQVKMYKNHVRTIFWNCGCQKNCRPLWREAHFQVKMYKT